MDLRPVLMDEKEGLYINLTDIDFRLQELEKKIPPKPDPEIGDASIVFVDFPKVTIGSVYKFYAWELCKAETTTKNITIDHSTYDAHTIYYTPGSSFGATYLVDDAIKTAYGNYSDFYIYGENSDLTGYVNPLSSVPNPDTYTLTKTTDYTKTTETRQRLGIFVYTIAEPDVGIDDSKLYFVNDYGQTENYQFDSTTAIDPWIGKTTKLDQYDLPRYFSNSDTYDLTYYPITVTTILSGVIQESRMYKTWEYKDGKLYIYHPSSAKAVDSMSCDISYIDKNWVIPSKIVPDALVDSLYRNKGKDCVTRYGASTQIPDKDWFGFEESYVFNKYDWSGRLNFMFSSSQPLFVVDNTDMKLCIKWAHRASTYAPSGVLIDKDSFAVTPVAASGRSTSLGLITDPDCLVITMPTQQIPLPIVNSPTNSKMFLVRTPSKDLTTTLKGYITNNGSIEISKTDTISRKYYTDYYAAEKIIWNDNNKDWKSYYFD